MNTDSRISLVMFQMECFKGETFIIHLHDAKKREERNCMTGRQRGCMCVCVCERQREREGGGGRE